MELAPWSELGGLLVSYACTCLPGFSSTLMYWTKGQGSAVRMEQLYLSKLLVLWKRRKKHEKKIVIKKVADHFQQEMFGIYGGYCFYTTCCF